MKHILKLKKASSKIIFLTLLAGSIVSTGCANRVVLHPILAQDIIVVKEGDSFTADRDGYFLSKRYMKEVIDAKVEKYRLR